MVEKFFQPLLPNIDKDEEFQPNKVLKDLHEDMWKVCQRLIFNQNQVNKTVQILVRVDCHGEDK